MDVTKLDDPDKLYARIDEKIYNRRHLSITENYRFNRIRDRISLEAHRRLKERFQW